MKKLIATFLIATLTITLHAGEITYFSGTWAETIAKAKAEKKIVMLDCYTDWCVWCKVMDKSTLQSDTTLDVLNKSFICARREMEKDPEGIKLDMKYLISGYPTYLFFDGDGKLIYQVIGYRATADFVEELKKAIDPKTQQSYPGFSTNLEPGYPQFYKNAFGTGTERKFPDSDTVMAYLDRQKDLKCETSWAVMQMFRLNAKYSKWVLDNADALKNLYGSDNVQNKIYKIIFAKADSAALKQDQKLFDEAVADLKKAYPGQDLSGTIRSWQYNYYLSNKDFDKVVKLMQSIGDTCSENSWKYFAGEVNNTSWTIFEKCDDIKVCESLLPIVRKAAEVNNDWPTYDTYANLLFKTGHYAEAKIAAEKGIEIGKKNNDNTKPTEDLLVQINAKLK
ncbi:MAG TPA: thioredoxin family protein [Bacteroidia bacterium]|jgi:thioredoxin-related protein|nr:thioredoxin family protein [Bacteroidia bacterium]